MTRSRMSARHHGEGRRDSGGSGRRLRRTVAGIASGATFVSLAVGIAPQAQAAGPDAATAAVNDLLTRLANDFLPDVASSTALSQQLPTLAVTPAESVDLRNAFKDL